MGCNPETNALVASNDEIIEKVYSPSYLYPENFVVPGAEDGSIYYENSISIGSSKDKWLQLHTDSKDEALAWSEISSKSSAYYRELVLERNTEMYFEYKRVYAKNPTDVILSRVHKTSYFIPKLDKFKDESQIGTLTARPITMQTVKNFVEYIWSSGVLKQSDKVLETSVIKSENRFIYNLKSAQLTGGDWGITDLVYVNDINFCVDAISGEVTMDSKRIKEITGKRR
jgi:hypothetical protein